MSGRLRSILEKYAYTAVIQPFSVSFLQEDRRSSLAFSLLHIRSQFLVQFFFPYIHKGIWPSSSSTPVLVVPICTPNRSLQNFMYMVSMGLVLGSFRHPQKSDAYRRIGLIQLLKRCSVMLMSALNKFPSLLLRA